MRQPDALQESALVDIRLDVVTSTAWILLDCRGSLHVPEANTAVVVLLGADHGSWQLPRAGTFAWQTVIDWRVMEVGDGIELSIGLLAGGDVVLRAVRGEYFVGDVPGGRRPSTRLHHGHARRGPGRHGWLVFRVHTSRRVLPLVLGPQGRHARDVPVMDHVPGATAAGTRARETGGW